MSAAATSTTDIGVRHTSTIAGVLEAQLAERREPGSVLRHQRLERQVVARATGCGRR